MFGVFLSSTFQDFGEYRNEVSDALAEDADVRAPLLEHAAGPYEPAVAMCREVLRGCNGYLLLLAHWYGSIPPPGPKSITHLEFEWACDQWKDLSRWPIAVLMPQAGSPADMELKEKAATLLTQASEPYRSDHARLMDEFQRQVTGNWRRVMYFPTRERAARKALVAYFYWRGDHPLRAADAGGQSDGRKDDLLSPASLGSLGRKEQIDALQREVAGVKIRPGVPAAAFLVTGSELFSGQQQFLEHVSRSGMLPGRPAAPVLLPVQPFPAAGLPGWASDQLGFSGAERAETIADLAARVAVQLKKQPLTLLLADVAALAGGAASWVRDFWLPLYHALVKLRQQQGFKYRLFAVVANYEEPAEAWPNPVRAGDPAYYETLVALPTLGNITEDALAQWLERNAVAEEQRPAIIQNVLKGKPSEIPSAAFERLRRQAFQFEEETD